MEVLVIQPPSPPTVILDQTGGRVGHLAPPWLPMCLLSFIRQRTRHTGRIFDARFRVNWEEQLEANLATKKHADMTAVFCGRHDADAVGRVVAVLRRVRPEMPLVGFGEMPVLNPPAFRAEAGVHFGLVGDPEPTLRHLLDNYAILFRRQRIAGLLQDGAENVAPIWASDLKTLALPEWSVVSLSNYDSPAYPNGMRVDLCLSRGAGRHPIDALVRPDGAPFRAGPMEQYSDALQAAAHLGIVEVHFSDPPDVWESGRLGEWLDRLERIHNPQDWSLRLLALPLGEEFRARLVEQRCRRIELLVPSCDPEQAALLGYEIPGTRALLEMQNWFQKHGIALDFVFWIGGSGEPRGEAQRIIRFVKSLRYCPFALEARPDVPPTEPRLHEIARDVKRSLTFSPMRRIRSLFSRIKTIRISIDEEHRDLVTQPRAAAQTSPGEQNFQALEKQDAPTSKDWKP